MLTVKAKKGDLGRVTAAYTDRFAKQPPEPLRTAAAECAGQDETHDYFRVTLRDAPRRLAYYFILNDRDGNTAYLGANGVQDLVCYDNQMRFQLPYLHPADSPNIPRWYRESTIYQIFPDSFAQSAGKIREQPREYEIDGIGASVKIGGTIGGIRENIPYLKRLGIDLLYLNPIFCAVSYHKYDTLDYFRIDPAFGAQEDFTAFVEECHKSGIRVLLDLVLNQSGMDYPAFRDVRERGADSPYADWYHIRSFPVDCGKNPNYETFGHYPQMPKFNTGNPDAAEHLIQVGRHWLQYGVDGYRLDVANEISHDFWRRFRMEMQKIKPDIVLIGEVWHDAPAWLRPDQFHGVMNFPLLYAMWEFFAFDTKNVNQFAQTLVRLTVNEPWDYVCAKMNFLCNHDTMRTANAVGFDPRRQRLALAFLFSFPGVPLVYYGDEKSMRGASADGSREKMVWQDGPEEAEMLEYYRQIISLRKVNPALVSGDFHVFLQDPVNNVLGFTRGTDEARLFCLFNRSAFKAPAPLPGPGAYIDLISRAETAVPVLGPYQAMILKRVKI